MVEWRRACGRNDVKEDAPLGIEIDGMPIGIFCTEGEFFAIEDVCSHEFALLSGGYQEGDTIECPLHQALFNIKTGEHLTEPATCGVRTYPVKVEGEDIFVDIEIAEQ